MTVTFHNVTISLEANTPRQAYKALCARLKVDGPAHAERLVAWETDTWSVDGGEERSTDALCSNGGNEDREGT